MGIWDWFSGNTEEDPELAAKKAKAVEALTQARHPVYDQSQVPMNAYRRYRATQGDTNVNPAVARAEGAIISGLPRIVTAPFEMANFARQIYDYNVNTEKVDEEGAARPWQERWSDAQYGGTEEAVKLADEKVRRVKELIVKGDKRDPEDIFKEVEESPEFKTVKEEHLPYLRRYTDKAANAIDYVAGAPIDEEKSTGEKLLTMGAQSLFPATIVGNALKAAKIPGPVRTIADVFLTPGTSHYTPGGLAANVAVGGALITGLDAAVGNENNNKIYSQPVDPRMPPPGLVTPGNIDLNNRPIVPNKDGKISTVRSITVGMDDKTYVLPTVSEDGRILSNDEAVKQFRKTGKHLGVFNDQRSADEFSFQLHLDQEKQYKDKFPANPPLPPQRPKGKLGSVPAYDDKRHEANLLSSTLSNIPGIKEAAGMAALAAAFVAGPKYVKSFAKQMNISEIDAEKILTRASKASEAAKKTGGAFVSGGPGKIDPLTRRPNAVRHAFDEHAPTQDFLEAVLKDRKAAQDEVTAATIHAGSNQTAQMEQWKHSGMMPGTTKTTVPLRVLHEAAKVFQRDGRWEQFSEYIVARTTRNRRQADIDDVNLDIHENIVAQSIKSKKGELKELATLKDEFDELVKRRDQMWEDHPDTRGSMSLWSNPDIEMKIRAGDADPDFKKMADLIDQSYKDQMDMLVASGVKSRADADIEQARNPHYSYLQDQELADIQGNPLSGFRRTFAKFGRLMTPHNPAEVTASHRLLPHRSRQETSMQTAVNNPVNALDALHDSWESAIRYVGRENLKKAVIDAAKKGNPDDLLGNMVQYSDKKTGQTSFSVAQVRQMVANPKMGFDITKWTSVNRNGRLEFYQFPRDPLLSGALQQAPSWTIPLLHQLSNSWRQGTTGNFQPGYGPIAAITNTRTFSGIRPSGTVFGTDYLVNKVTRGWLTGGTPMANRLHDLIRTMTTSYDPGAFALGAADTIKIFMLQEGKNIANHVAEGLMQDKGFFAMLARAPGGKAFVQKLADIGANAYANSYLPMITHHRAGDLAVVNGMTSIKKEVDTFITANFPQGLETAVKPIAESLNTLRFFINSMRNSANVGYVYRNIESTRLPDGSFDWDKVRKLMDDARVLGDGNMARRPSSAIIQLAQSASPYLGTNIRSNTVRMQRMLTDKRMMTTYILGAAMPKLYTEYLMSHWDKEAFEYYNHDMPQWKRIYSIILPTPATIWKWKVLGEKVPFSPDAVFETRLNPEDLPLTEAVSQMMRGLGLYGLGQRDPILDQDIPSGLYSWYEAVRSSYLPMLPPVAEGVMEGMNAMNPFAGGTAPRLGEENLNLTSEVPSAVSAVLTTLLGVTGTRLAESMDSGLKTYEGSNSIWDALLAGGTEFVERTVQSLPEDLPLIKKGNQKIYTYNEVSRRAMATRKLLGNALYGSESIKTDEIENPVLKDATVYMKEKLNGSSFAGTTLKKISDEARALENEIKALDAERYSKTQRRHLDYNERSIEMNKRRKDLNNLNEKQAMFYNDLQADLVRHIGPQWQKAFGKEFNFENWRKQVDEERVKNKMSGGVGARRYPSSRTAQ